jgi:hypothetical protein
MKLSWQDHCLMVDDTEFLFTYVLAIFISSFDNIYSEILPLLMVLLVFVNFLSSLYILDSSPL